MIKLYIDGKKILAKEGQSVIEAMDSVGIELPHFCWHPKLSVSGNCRTCLVEIGMPKKDREGKLELDEEGNEIISYIPKLQIGCATPIQDGMHVRASSDKVLKARRGVMEFLLINHPLDCPICDEAGDCQLQDYSFQHSIGESRFTEEKNVNPKNKRHSWSDKIYYDAERCILCSRCIKFSKEVAKQDILTFVNRSDKVFIQLEEGKVFDNRYSMNIIDNCPVGALTSADFRFRSRVWDMSFGDTISPFDSVGSEITIGTKKNKILRITPKMEMRHSINWITDEVRLGYNFVNDNRTEVPSQGRGKEKTNLEWADYYKEVATKLSKFKPSEIMVLASPLASLEDNEAIINFARNTLKTKNIAYLEHYDINEKEDGFLITKDKSPNLNGIKSLGLKKENNDMAKDLPNLLRAKTIKAIFIMEEDFKYNEEILNFLDKAELIISNSYNKDRVWELSDYSAPTSTFAEISGTYINKDNKKQNFKPLLLTKENQSKSAMRLGRLDKFGADNDKWNQYDIPDYRQSKTIIKGISKYIEK